MSIDIKSWLDSSIPGIKWNGNGTEGNMICPYHDDHNPSLYANPKREVFYCQACGQGGHLSELAKFLGLTYPGSSSLGGEKTEYEYVDETGKHVCTLVRIDFSPGEKFFYRLDKGVDVNVIYNLPEVQSAIKEEKNIFWVEGEKDVESLRGKGYVATTTINGSNSTKQLPVVIKDLPISSKIILCGDADIPGQKYLKAVGTALTAKGISPKVILPEHMGYSIEKDEGKDISDWLIKNSDVDGLINKAIPFDDFLNQQKSSQENSPEMTFDDQGMAELLNQDFSNEIKYNTVMGKWFLYRDGKWKKDEKNEIFHYLKDLQKGLHLYAAGLRDKNKIEEIEDFIPKLRNINKQKNILCSAQNEKRIATHPDEFDRNRLLFNVANGTIDLQTGELLPHNPKDLITKKSDIVFNGLAKPDKWLKFLDEIFLGRKELIDFIQVYFGYALSGNVNEQIFPVFFGTGANGKSVLINTIRNILGDYVIETPAETLIQKKNGRGASNDIARFRGARFVVAQESEDGGRLDESKIKSLTGGDKQVARYLFHEFFEFESESKVVLITNHKPRIRGSDYGIWRRVLLVPFEYTVPQDKQDKYLESKLKEESQGILSWMVEGCLKWQKEGLNIPETIKASTEDYKNEEDSLGNFLEECVENDSNSQVQSSVLYSHYKAWIEQRGEYLIDNRLFSKRLEEKGYKKTRVSYGFIWSGIKIRLIAQANLNN